MIKVLQRDSLPHVEKVLEMFLGFGFGGYPSAFVFAEVDMRLTMHDRKTVTKALCEQYRRASKGKKGRILDEFVKATGYTRCYARRVLRNHGRRIEVAPGAVVLGDRGLRCPTKRKRYYGADVVCALKKLWPWTDYLCGKRLKPALPGLIQRLEACKEIRLNKSLRAKLVSISAATIDRLLKPEREKHTLKHRGVTKPGSLLKREIPIRTFSDWDEARPGFLEIDLVAHEGGLAKGDFCLTLDATDVASGWTELAAVQNKAQIHVFAALKQIQTRLPFPMLGIDSDNGSEFINHQLTRYCRSEKIAFTRSRPYRKNDTCYVEQKNWSIVRRFAGYARLVSPQACATLNELYQVVRDYTNFFLPSLKLREKVRDGAKITRRYFPAQTPYQRLLESAYVSPHSKRQLTQRYNTLNPAALHRRILALQRNLHRLSQKRRSAA